jgi:hypothetical protein
MHRFIHIGLIAGASMALLVLVGLIWLRYPDNHGAGPFAFRWFFGALLVLALMTWVIMSKPPFLAAILSLIGFVATWLLDHRNIMVDYDEWINRGMPEWGVVKAIESQQVPNLLQAGETKKGDP